jgi:hypothetical protein
MIEAADLMGGLNARIQCADSMPRFNVRIQYAQSLHSLNVIAVKIEMKLSRTLSVQY